VAENWAAFRVPGDFVVRGEFFVLPGLLCLDFLLRWFQGQGIARALAISLVFATGVYSVVVTWIWPRISARRRIDRRQSQRKESLEDPCPAEPPTAELVRSAVGAAALADGGERWLRPSVRVVLWIGALAVGHLLLLHAGAFGVKAWNGVLPVNTVAELCLQMAAMGALLATGFWISWLRHRRVAWWVGPQGVVVYHGDTLRRSFAWAEVVSLEVHRAAVIVRLASRPFKERLQWPEKEGAAWLRGYARERLGDRMDKRRWSRSMAKQGAEPIPCPTCTATLDKRARFCERCGTINWSAIGALLGGLVVCTGLGALAFWGSSSIAWPVVSQIAFVLGVFLLAISVLGLFAVITEFGRARQLASSWRRTGSLARTGGNGGLQDGPGQ
jgi:hypothetical protein